MKAGKIWGQTELIHANGVLEFHRIEYKAGYKCSEHEHKFKWNGFFVESGKMLVRVWQDGEQKGLVDETILNAGDFTRVKPGMVHQFEGLEDGVAFVRPSGEFPNKSKFVRVSSLPDNRKTNDYLDQNGDINTAYGDGTSFLPPVGSGSYGGAFGFGTGIDGGSYPIDSGPVSQTAGSNGDQNQQHPFAFYENISATNSQGIDMATSATRPAGTAANGGYGTALSILSNKDEYDINLLFLPGVIDDLSNHSSIIGQAIEVCEDRGDCFLVYDNAALTATVATAKTRTEARNSSFAATYYPWIQIQDTTTGNFRYVPPSVVIAGVYHFNDTVGQPWFAPAGLNRGGIDSAVQAYKKLSQANRDDLYESNVNPIATFPGQGVTVFGQKTTQKKASALDRVNVRRLLINLKKFVANSSRGLVFEQNTTDLRNQFLNVVNPYMDQVQHQVI